MDAINVFELLLRPHTRVLAYYLYCCCEDTAHADYLFLETIQTAWHNLAKYERGQPFDLWLLSVSKKLLQAELRRGNLSQSKVYFDLVDKIDEFREYHRILTLRTEINPEVLEQILPTIPEELRQRTSAFIDIHRDPNLIVQQVDLGLLRLKERPKIRYVSEETLRRERFVTIITMVTALFVILQSFNQVRLPTPEVLMNYIRQNLNNGAPKVYQFAMTDLGTKTSSESIQIFCQSKDEIVIEINRQGKPSILIGRHEEVSWMYLPPQTLIRSSNPNQWRLWFEEQNFPSWFLPLSELLITIQQKYKFEVLNWEETPAHEDGELEPKFIHFGTTRVHSDDRLPAFIYGWVDPANYNLHRLEFIWDQHGTRAYDMISLTQVKESERFLSWSEFLLHYKPALVLEE